jgi:glycerol uptake facilitator-like aquaporin
MECIGTFFLTVAISLTGNPIAIGLVLMSMIYVGGHISGGHFNPAVSLVFFLQKRLSMNHLFLYSGAQSVGAFLALCLFMMVTNNVFSPEIIPGSSVVAAMTMEALLTAVLCWVCLTMGTTRMYSSTSLAGLVIGLTLVGIAFIGGLFNPAVAVGSFGCNLFKIGVLGDVATVIVYVAGPFFGSVLASLAFNSFNSEV